MTMHRSTFTGLNMAFLGLNAAQTALDVTGQNITNMNTEGYTRQRLDQIAIGPTGPSAYHMPYGARVGQGVLVTGVSQIRDPYLDNAYRSQLSKLGTEDARSTTLERIGDIFDDVDANRMQEALDDVVKQLQELSLRIGQGGEDNLVRSTFSTYLNYIHQNATDLEGIRKDLEEEMSLKTIPDINEAIKEIAKLNETIRNAQVMGDPALELKDERNLKLDELATWLPIKTEIGKKVLGGQFEVETLKVSLVQPDGSTISLVDDDQYNQMEFVPADPAVAGSKSGVTLKDKDGNGVTDSNGAAVGTLMQDALSNGVLKGKLQMLNCEGAFDGSGINGIGYYQKMLDAFVYTLATGMNDLNKQYMVPGIQLDEKGNPVEDANGNPVTITGAGGDLFESSVAGEAINAMNIKIADDWMSGKTRLIPSKEAAFGNTSATANDNILQMKDFLSTKEIDIVHPDYKDPGSGDLISIFKGTLPAGYANIQTEYGIDKKSTDSALKNHTLVLQAAADARESVMGVNLDEEVMDLLKYAQSYGAAARLMTTMDEALDRLINNTGIVGR